MSDTSFTEREIAVFRKWDEKKLRMLFYTTEETAELIGVSQGRLGTLISSGRLPTFNRFHTRHGNWYSKKLVNEWRRRPEFLRDWVNNTSVYVDEFQFLSEQCGQQWAFSRLCSVYGLDPSYFYRLLRTRGVEVPMSVCETEANRKETICA